MYKSVMTMVRIAVRRQSVIPRPTGRRPGKFHRNLSTTSFGVKQTNKYDQKHNLPENVMAICESTRILQHFQMSTFCSPLYQKLRTDRPIYTVPLRNVPWSRGFRQACGIGRFCGGIVKLRISTSCEMME